MKRKNKDWIIFYIDIKHSALEFAYCRGDINSAHKIEEDIERLRTLYEKT